SIAEFVVGGARAADLAQHDGGGEALGPPVGVGQQRVEGLPLVVMRDRPAQGPPQPLDAVRLGVVARRVDQDQGVLGGGRPGAREPGGGGRGGCPTPRPPPRPGAAGGAGAGGGGAKTGAAGRPASSDQSSQPSRQSTSPKPYRLVLVPGVSTRRWPRRP